MDTLLEGDGLAPLVGVDVRRGSAVVLGVSHGVLPGGGGCDHWGAGRQEGDKGGRQRRERKDASGFAGGFKTMGSIRRPQRGQRESGWSRRIRPFMPMSGLILPPALLILLSILFALVICVAFSHRVLLDKLLSHPEPTQRLRSGGKRYTGSRISRCHSQPVGSQAGRELLQPPFL